MIFTYSWHHCERRKDFRQIRGFLPSVPKGGPASPSALGGPIPLFRRLLGQPLLGVLGERFLQSRGQCLLERLSALALLAALKLGDA